MALKEFLEQTFPHYCFTRIGDTMHIDATWEWATSEAGRAAVNDLERYCCHNPEEIKEVRATSSSSRFSRRISVDDAGAKPLNEMLKPVEPVKKRGVHVVVEDVLRRIVACPVCRVDLDPPVPGSLVKECPNGCGNLQLSSIGQDGTIGVVFMMSPWEVPV